MSNKRKEQQNYIKRKVRFSIFLTIMMTLIFIGLFVTYSVFPKTFYGSVGILTGFTMIIVLSLVTVLFTQWLTKNQPPKS